MSILKVKLCYAEGLKSADSNGLSDPFAKLTLGEATFKSAIIKKSLSRTCHLTEHEAGMSVLAAFALSRV